MSRNESRRDRTIRANRHFRRRGPLGWDILLAMVLAWTAAARGQTVTQIWSFATGSWVVSSPALGPDGTLYVGSEDSKLYAVLPDGTKKWELKTGGMVDATPAIGSDGTIYVGSRDKRFYAVNPDGSVRWQFVTDGEIDSSAAIDSANNLYFGSRDGRLYALNAQGTTNWVFSTGAGISASPSVGADGTIYVGSYDAKLYSLGPTGTTNWAFATGNAIQASVAIGVDETIYVGSMDGKLYSIKSDGTKQWEFTTERAIYCSPSIGPDGTIYIGSTDNKFYAVNPDGSQKWSFTTGDYVMYSTASVAADGTIYVGSLDNKLYAFNANGSVKWTFTAGYQVRSSPLLGPDGLIFVGSLDYQLYCLKGTSALASAPWPTFQRNSRRTGAGFVSRQLPPEGFSVGRHLYVALRATPPAHTAVYEIEDQPPAGWLVGAISNHGNFDAANRKVKFGPFFDDTPRVLTYEITPASGSGGQQVFAGSASADAIEVAIGGQCGLSFVPLHPADLNPVDGQITLSEMTAYSTAWKRGDTWPAGPNPIPINYVTKAVSLWQQGELYRYQSNLLSAPLYWVKAATPPATAYPVVLATNLVSSATNAATVLMSRLYAAGVPISIVLTAAPDTNVLAYAAEDQLPAGWLVTTVTEGGFYDPIQHKVKWGPFFDNTPRALSYTAVPPVGATGLTLFVGAAAYDGASLPWAGQRAITDSPVPAALTLEYSPTNGFFRLNIQLEQGFDYLLQASSDLTNWTTLTNHFADTNLWRFTDPDFSNYTERYFRVLLP